MTDIALKEYALSLFEDLSQVIARRSREGAFTALGYSSNLDILLDFHVEILNELLAQYVPDGILSEMNPVPLVRTKRELLETIVSYCRRGVGGEADIDDLTLICKSFPCKNGMGGTAVQAALALAQFGANSIVHLTDDSVEVRRMLDYPCIKVPLQGGELGGAMDVVGKNPQEVHAIIQFQKGSVIRLGEQEFAVPCSNRLILTRNTINTELPLDENYLVWIEQHACQVSSNVLSSFNCILEKKVLKKRLERVKAHIEIYHRNNPSGIVYFEDAHYHDSAVRKLCIESLYSHVDILSMNEEELLNTLIPYGVSVDLSDILSCIRGVEYLLETFRVKKGIVVHTKDYAMYIGIRDGMDIERGLFWGSMLATAKAAFGNYGNDEEVKWVLRQPFSETGLRNREIIHQNRLEERALLIPTFYLDRPKYTIGLGDSFTGGMQLCF